MRSDLHLQTITGYCVGNNYKESERKAVPGPMIVTRVDVIDGDVGQQV